MAFAEGAQGVTLTALALEQRRDDDYGMLTMMMQMAAIMLTISKVNNQPLAAWKR
jgi:hypothetical protein